MLYILHWHTKHKFDALEININIFDFQLICFKYATLCCADCDIVGAHVLPRLRAQSEDSVGRYRRYVDSVVSAKYSS